MKTTGDRRTDIQSGDMFATDGYDLMASAKYAETGGEVIVLSNNSTHFLVAVRHGDADDMAQLESAYRYALPEPRGLSPEQAVHGAYQDALAKMIAIALNR